MHVLYWPLFLLFLAIAFVFLELMIPSGGLLSFLAAVSMVASVVVAFVNGGPAFGTAWLAATVVVLPAVIALAVRCWPHTPFGRRIINLPSQIEDDEETIRLRTLIGKHGTARTVMLPAGAIVLDGQILDALSEGMPIEAGQPIQVTQVEGNRILVRPAEPGQEEKSPQEDDILSRPIDSLGLDELDEPLT